MNKFEKLKVSLRYWLLAKAEADPNYYKAVDALEYAAGFHVGTRKDGCTPEFQHQLEIAHYLRTLHPRGTGSTPAVSGRWAAVCASLFGRRRVVGTPVAAWDGKTARWWVVLAAALLHDVAEDYDISFEELEARFGPEITHVVRLLTKKHRGVVVPLAQYFALIAQDPEASLIKGADRIHNLQSMLGVFTLQKQAAYCAEVEEHFLPMLKAARRLFPQQEPVYENIKLVLRSQLQMLAAVRAAAGVAA